MKQSGIAFQGPMVRAILRDVDPKTVTRRVAKLPPDARDVRYWTPPSGRSQPGYADPGVNYWTDGGNHLDRCPHGQPGDILYVREAVWMWCERRPNGKTGTGRDKWLYVPLDAAPVHYQVDHPAKPTTSVVSPTTGNLWCWRLKIARFMPRRVARIRLEITDIRIERLQEITEVDAIAEGIEKTPNGFWSLYGQGSVDGTYSPVAAYRALWESINGAGSWDRNDFVWCIYFRRIES